MKWKLEIEMKLGKNGIRIEIEFFFRMEITLIAISTLTVLVGCQNLQKVCLSLREHVKIGPVK